MATFLQLETLTTSPFEVRRLTFFIVQFSAYSIDPACAPCAVTFAKLTLTIGFSGSPLAVKIRVAPVTSTFSILISRKSQYPLSIGKTGVLSTVQYGGM